MLVARFFGSSPAEILAFPIGCFLDSLALTFRKEAEDDAVANGGTRAEVRDKIEKISGEKVVPAFSQSLRGLVMAKAWAKEPPKK